ncbi:hypothetical protein SAMN05216588_10812 [Pseudomonas flavescens]|uniref:Uncharacterized protein n=1 Tax=Phytopseudomonas flavescens TaxID=29435 RepID=A0A1G8FRE4_9GAMM|nr:hypothetical protein SAMN05216588_10812 [Pseudomonas flavescens]
MTTSQIATLASVEDFLARPHASFIDGEQRQTSTGTVRGIFDPATNRVISRTRQADAHQVERIVRSARQAFETGVWSGPARAYPAALRRSGRGPR